MTDFSNYNLAPYDSTLPDRFALLKIRNSLVDVSILMNGAYTDDGLGITDEVISPVDHFAILGRVPAPIADPQRPERIKNVFHLFYLEII